MELTPSGKAWSALAVGVLAYDLLCPEGETLSEGVDRALERRRGKYLAMAAIGITATHLCNLIPESVDPLHKLTQIRRKKLAEIDGLEEYED